MKIYYIVNARIPTERAHGIQLAKMCEAMIEQGAEVELVVPRRRTVPATVREFYGLRVDVPMRRLLVIDTYRWGRAGFLFGSASFVLSYALYMLAKRARGEQAFIYTNDIDQFSFIAIPFLGMPYGAEIHDAKSRRFTFTLFFRRASAVIAINATIAENLSRIFGISKEKILIHPNGIDPLMFTALSSQEEARTRLSIPQGGTIVLYSGAFLFWKGLEAVIDAARFLGDDIHFLLVGGREEELREVTERKEIPKNIICCGMRPYPEIPLWIAAADILLVTGTRKNDYSYHHTSPMKLFEYMAAQKPVVAADTPAIRQVAGEDMATFYEPDNAEDLAVKIRSILTEPQRTEEQARRAALHVEQYAWSRRAEGILSFLNRPTD